MSVVKTRIGIAVLLLAGCFTSRVQCQQYSWQHLPQVNKPVFKKDTINILKYGAKADGITLNTTSINKAISAWQRQRGGVVLIPQGLWLTGPLVMKSNVNLHVSRAALSSLLMIKRNINWLKAIMKAMPLCVMNRRYPAPTLPI